MDTVVAAAVAAAMAVVMLLKQLSTCYYGGPPLSKLLGVWYYHTPDKVPLPEHMRHALMIHVRAMPRKKTCQKRQLLTSCEESIMAMDAIDFIVSYP